MRLIEDLVSGHEKAFKAFYDKTYSSVYAFLLKHTQDEVMSKDLLQLAYIKFWEKKQFIEPSFLTFKSYLFTVARNLVIKEYKRKIAEQDAKRLFLEMQIEPENDLDKTHQLVAQVKDEVKLLPKKQQQVFQLVKFEGMTYKEVAKELSISESTVEKHVIQALRTLRRKLSRSTYFILF